MKKWRAFWLVMVILIKMFPGDGRYPVQKHLSDFVSKAKTYEE